MRSFFRFEEHGTSYKQEIIGGLTTFITMAYIVIVNPAILEAAGIPKGPSMVATVLSAVFGTVIMGIYARRPFAIAPYMGENAFIAFTVVKVLGYSWQTALGAIFIGGVLFTVLTLLKIRSWLVEAVPQSLKYSFAVGIGLWLAFIGLNEMGIVVSAQDPPVKMGALDSPSTLLSILCFVVIGILMFWKVNGAMLIGIIGTTILSILLHVTDPPTTFVSLPPSLAPIFLQLDIIGALSWGFFSVILTVFVMDFLDTMGTLIGVSARAGLLDENGNLPEIEKPMLADSLATVIGALLGTTTSGTYLESAAGVEAGARTGFSSLVTAFFFLLTLFFSPFVEAIPKHAYGPALVIVGLLMLGAIKNINFEDFTEAIPAFSVIALTSFTYNLGIGMTSGFVLYPLFKVCSGRIGEIHVGLWALAAMSLLFYIFYPYS